jgi:hypothetical protein
MEPKSNPLFAASLMGASSQTLFSLTLATAVVAALVWRSWRL